MQSPLCSITIQPSIRIVITELYIQRHACIVYKLCTRTSCAAAWLQQLQLSAYSTVNTARISKFVAMAYAFSAPLLDSDSVWFWRSWFFDSDWLHSVFDYNRESMQSPLSIMYIQICARFSPLVQSTECTLCSTEYKIQSTVYTTEYTLYTSEYTV